MLRPAMIARLFGPIFIFAGIMHFVIPKTYAAIVPDWVPGTKEQVVYVSGVAEIVGGAATMHPATRRFGSLFSIATLLAVFPANVKMALEADEYADRVPGGAAALWGRLPFQALFIAWAAAAGRNRAGEDPAAD